MDPHTMDAALRRRALRAAGVFALIGAMLEFCFSSPLAFMAPTGSTAERAAPEVVAKVSTPASETVHEQGGAFWKQPHYLKVLLMGKDMRKGFGAVKRSADEHDVQTLWSKSGDWYAQGGRPKKVCVYGGEKQNIMAVLKDHFDVIGEGDDDWKGRVSFLVPFRVGLSVLPAIREAVSQFEGASVNLRKGGANDGLLNAYGSKDLTLAVAAALLDQLENFPEEMRAYRSTQQNNVDYVTFPTSIQTELTTQQKAAVIGKGGRRIQDIRDQFFVEAIIKDNMLQLTGNLGDVQAAHAMIVQQLNAPRRERLPRIED